MPEERQKEIDFLHDFIQKAVPKLKVYYASNMIGYGSLFYLDTKKQKKEWPIISLANQNTKIPTSHLTQWLPTFLVSSLDVKCY